MRRILMMAVFMSAFIAITACAQKKNGSKQRRMETKTLVVYFSATGTTESVAKKLAAVADADIFKIEAANKYSTADLDWTNRSSRSSRENADGTSRPAIVKRSLNVAKYDKIYLGYPIWWNIAPRVVNTFLENYDLSGKIVVPFATSGCSGITNSVDMLKKSYPKIKWQSGRLLNHPSASDLKDWAM